MTRCLARVVVALALVACAFVPATATHAAAPEFSIVDVPDDSTSAEPAPGATMSEQAVERLAAQDPGVRAAMRLRPGRPITLRFDPVGDRWTAEVRDTVTRRLLASVEIDDRRSVVTDSFALPLGEYPSHLTERQAIDAAVADSRVRSEARAWGGVVDLRARGRFDGCCWEVDLYAPKRTDGDPDDPVIRVDVVDGSESVTGVWTDIQISWRMARGERGAFGGDINQRFIWLPLFVVFALVAIDWTRIRSRRTLDVFALLVLGVSHEAFLQGKIDWSVPLALPPLVWLAGSMAWVFLRGLPPQRPAAAPRSRLGRLALRSVPTMAIVVCCVALAGVRIGLTLDGGNVIDVGYAGVAGARLELEGDAPWGNMPADNARGDTYGPANYLAYVPATALLDDPDAHQWGVPLPAAQWTAIVADLGCALLLAAIGWRWISRRGAALLAVGWLACPWTAWALTSGVNDALLALPLLGAFAALPRAWLRGGLVGIAAMVKFAPLAVLAPMLHVGAARRRRQSFFVILGCGAVLAAGLAWVVFRLDGGIRSDLHTFWDRTVGFQTGRDSPFSIWGLYGWDLAQRVFQAGVAVVLVAACVWPRARDAWQVAAGAAAALLLAQLAVSHWFYLYVPWFLGFVLLVLVASRERPTPEPADADMLDA